MDRTCLVNRWEALEPGPNPPKEIHAVIECPKGEENNVAGAVTA
ncbi:hypothetical protein [Natronorubrum thiooxidans]